VGIGFLARLRRIRGIVSYIKRIKNISWVFVDVEEFSLCGVQSEES